MTITLDKLKLGQHGIVTQLLCTGATRRRLMDLGIIVGTPIQAELRSALGDPIAYRVREALIGLRHKQAQEIEVEIIKS